MLYLLYTFNVDSTLILLLNDPDYEKQQAHCSCARGGKDLPRLLQTLIKHFPFTEICSVSFYLRFFAGSWNCKKKEILRAEESYLLTFDHTQTFRQKRDVFLLRSLNYIECIEAGNIGRIPGQLGHACSRGSYFFKRPKPLPFGKAQIVHSQL